jgi:uncharacterized protein involved in exopolysaccharide biosynthesis
MSEDGVSGFQIFLSFFRILVRRKRLIFLLTVVPTVLCIVWVLLTRSTYQAEALVNPPQGGASGLESVLGGMEGGAGGLLSSVLGDGSSGLYNSENILQSVRFGRLVIDRFNLDSVYGFKPGQKHYFVDVHKAFRRQAKYEVTDENAIWITVKDESPERALQVVTYMIHVLDSLYIDIQRTEITHRLRYIDQRLAIAEKEMKAVEDSMVAFQTRSNLLAPEAQIKLILQNTAQTEIKLETLKEQMALEASLRGTSSAHYHDLSTQKTLLEKSLRNQFRREAGPNSLVLPAMQLPGLATEYFRLERAYLVRLGVYKFLVQQVEALKLNAEQNVQVISVIDPPWANDKRVEPKRRVMVQATFIIFLMLSITLAVLLALWQKHVRENPETRAQVLELRRNLLKWW